MSLADRTTQSLYEHPEGTDEMPQDPDGSRSICAIQTCKEFVEVGHGLHPYRRGLYARHAQRIPRTCPILPAHGRRGRRDPPAPLHGMRGPDPPTSSSPSQPSGTNTAAQPHSASKNHLRIPRFITNPPVTLKAPLNLSRADPADYVRALSPPCLSFPLLQVPHTHTLVYPPCPFAPLAPSSFPVGVPGPKGRKAIAYKAAVTY